MNKAQFIKTIVKTGGYNTKVEAEKAYDAVMGTFSVRLSKGTAKDRVIRLPELGTFKMKTRKARIGRNPRTGKSIKIPSKRVVTFKGGKSLSKSL